MIHLALNNRTKNRAFGRVFFERVIVAAAPALKLPKGPRSEVGITLIGPAAIRTLNRKRRGVNAPTDVLSFPLHMDANAGYTEVSLGDLFICPEVVRVKADESGETIRTQMMWTVVHGLLHLAGYDHEISPSAAKKMVTLEKKILTTLNR